MFSFSFYPYSYHRDLHSFPTRRSSDLDSNSDSGEVVDLLVNQLLAEPNHSSLLGQLDTVLVERSEEHTSELQSHSDLVCRLLLEKKKIIDRRSDVIVLAPVS